MSNRFAYELKEVLGELIRVIEIVDPVDITQLAVYDDRGNSGLWRLDISFEDQIFGTVHHSYGITRKGEIVGWTEI